MTQGQWPPLDASLKERIASPSPAFEQFVYAFFLQSQIYARGEADSSLIERLSGEERDTAMAMIVSNVRSNWKHIIDAAADFGLRETVPTLREMLASDLPAHVRFPVARTLYRLGALEGATLHAMMESWLRDCSQPLARDILLYCYRLFPPDLAQHLIDIGLRRGDYHIRASAYNAAVASKYIRSKGGTFTPQIGQEIWSNQIGMATRGASSPTYYEQLQYYVGDDVFRDKSLFERRIAELLSSDRGKQQ